MERSRSRSPPRQRDPLLDLEYDQLIELYAKTSLLIQAMSAARFLIVNAQRELGDESIDPRFHEWAIALADMRAEMDRVRGAADTVRRGIVLRVTLTHWVEQRPGETPAEERVE